MAHDPAQDHIFGDRDEARHAPAPEKPRRVKFAGMFGAFDGARDLDLHPLARRSGDLPRAI